MARFYCTYGFNTNLNNCYSVVDAENYEQAREKIFAGTGGQFAFMYAHDEFADRIDKYGLLEVPLQPQYYNEQNQVWNVQ